MPRSLSAAALTLALASAALPAPAPAPSPAPKGPTPEQISKAVEDLGSPRFPVRERASKLLWEAGAAGEEALRAAAKSKDEETSSRAKAILDKFDWGLYPDTPADVVKLIEKFRGGDQNVRQEAVGELMRLKPARFSTLRKLIAQEQDEDARQRMYQAMAFQARRAVPALIVANQLDEAGELLEICLAPNNPTSMGDYAAFHHLRGTVPEAIRRMEAVRKRGGDIEGRRAAEALVYLHRVRQDWPAARKAAADARNTELVEDLAWESNDWKALAEEPAQEGVGNADLRGARAAYYRLAGNKAKYDELIAEMRKELTGVEGDDGAAYSLAHALLLNGQGADAIAVLKDRPKFRPDLAFDLLAAQLKFKEAFALADKAAKELDKEGDDNGGFQKDQLDLQRGKVLAGLGDRDAATQVFRGLIDRGLTAQRARSATDAIKAMARTGMRDLAAESAAKVLAHAEKSGQVDDAVSLLAPVLPEHKHVAPVWWHAFRRDQPDAEPAAVMARVLEFADRKADRKKADKLAGLIETLRNAKPEAPNPRQLAELLASPGPLLDYAIAEAYRAAGADDKAEEFYKKAAEAKHDPDDEPDLLDGLDEDDDMPAPVPAKTKYLLAYADFLVAKKKPKEAAALYKKAWDLAPAHALALFLYGNALARAGDEKEGTRLMGLAHWVPLGAEPARTRFSEELTRRGFDADSRKEMELTVAVGWFRSYVMGNVYLRLARLKARQKDYATAALYYEKDVVSLFRTTAQFVDPKAYLTVPELARTYRIRALLGGGKVDEAMAEVRAGLAVLPGNVELALGVVPDLDRAGKKKEADEVYGKVKAAYESALKDYGTSPDLRNGLAWTMVNCNRDLEEAKKHAEKAVAGAPKSAGYIDTLAEIHFRMKDRAKALELMKQCAALEPANPYFRKQLERFEKRPFDSPPPDEETGDDD